MSRALYRDPTLEAAQRLEIQERRCETCLQRVPLSTGELRCGTGQKWPYCMNGVRDGFELDTTTGGRCEVVMPIRRADHRAGFERG